MKHIRLYEDWNVNESSEPGSLKVISPSKNAGKSQYYYTTIKNPSVSFDTFKREFLTKPQKYLTNAKSTFHPPTDGKGNVIPKLKEGAFIQIDIADLMPVYVKVVKAYESDSGALHATFVTLEGHVEKGWINFAISKHDKEIKFEISSFSETNSLAPEDFARSEQKESWFSMLKNLPKLLGGTGPANGPSFSDYPPKKAKELEALLTSGRDGGEIAWSSGDSEKLIAKNNNKNKKPLIAQNKIKKTDPRA